MKRSAYLPFADYEKYFLAENCLLKNFKVDKIVSYQKKFKGLKKDLLDFSYLIRIV